ncbi:hypothetical protein V6N13_140775 [Hibiscus sabdariffa]
MPFDNDPRHSFDEPRASWDGYLMGKTFPRMPTMVSVVEDDAPVTHHVTRSDFEDESLPGGSAQTRDYYSDSSSRRSLDRSSSIRKTAAAIVAEMKLVSNAKVSPATVDYLYGPKLNSKKSRRWSKAWNIWGFIHRRIVNRDEEDRCSKANGAEGRCTESCPELRNGDVRGGSNPKVLRSNSSVSSRRKKMDEFVLESNRSARYSLDNGLSRFYLTPMRSSRRGRSGKSRASHAIAQHTHAIARSLLRLY